MNTSPLGVNTCSVHRGGSDSIGHCVEKSGKEPPLAQTRNPQAAKIHGRLRDG